MEARPAMQMQTETTTRTYKGAKDMERGVNQMVAHGWTVASSVSIPQRQGCVRIVLMGFVFAFMFPPKAKIVVSFARPLGTGVPDVSATVQQVTVAVPPPAVADELVKLADLRDREVLSLEEFDAMKAKLLQTGSATGAVPGTPGAVPLEAAAARLGVQPSTLAGWVAQSGTGNGGRLPIQGQPPLLVTRHGEELWFTF